MPEFTGMPTLDGKFKPDSPNAVKAFLSERARRKAVRPLVMTLEDWKADQSDAQRAKWFVSVVKPFCESMGYRFANEREKMIVHHEIMILLGRYETKRVLGRDVQIPKSMKKGEMTVEEFQQLWDDVQVLGAEWNVVIQDLSKSEIEALKKGS